MTRVAKIPFFGTKFQVQSESAYLSAGFAVSQLVLRRESEVVKCVPFGISARAEKQRTQDSAGSCGRDGDISADNTAPGSSDVLHSIFALRLRVISPPSDVRRELFRHGVYKRSRDILPTSPGRTGTRRSCDMPRHSAF